MSKRSELAAAKKKTLGESVRILTQFEAHREFPTSGYNEYDPMKLVVGTKAAIRAAFSQRNVGYLNGVEIANVEDANFDVEWLGVRSWGSCDVSKPKDTRIVIWLDNAAI